MVNNKVIIIIIFMCMINFSSALLHHIRNSLNSWLYHFRHMKDSAVVSRVREEAMEAVDQGIHGVPYFNIQLKGVAQRIAAFSGAQPPETFISIFQRLLNKLKASV